MNPLQGLSFLMNRTLSVYSHGYAIGADGGVTATPTPRITGIKVYIEPLSGDKPIYWGKPVLDSTHYFCTLTPLTLVNGDLLVDDAGNTYEYRFSEYQDQAIGQYFAILGKLVEG